MKKFSNITGQKVNEEPKVEIKIDETETFKMKVLNLMDQYLTVTTFGPVDRYLRAGNIKISGRELLAEALIDLLNSGKEEEQIKVLESLKSEIRDWQVIDEKIQSIKKEKTLISNRNKFNSMLNKYDSESLIEFTKESVNKIKDKKTLTDYNNLTLESKLSSETKSKLIEIYSERLNQLD
jgi:hypothetical protein